MENESPSETAKGRTPFDYKQLFSVLWASRKLIAEIIGAVTVLSLIVSFLLPLWYRSTVVILPAADQSKLSGLGGLTDLASLAGVNVGGEISIPKLYPTIVKSEAVLKNVIFQKYKTRLFPDSANLLQIWDIDAKDPRVAYETMLLVLREEVDVSLDIKTNVLSISLLTKEPQLSADIVNAIAHELDLFMRTKRTTNATEQRKWIEGRLRDVEGDLGKSENELKDFRENNRRIADSPQLLLEEGRYARQVQINSTLYTELKRQYELTRIEEIKNIPIVNIMDAGRPAAKKEKPERRLIVTISFFLSAMAGIGFVYVRHAYANEMKAVRVFLRGISHGAPSA